MNHRIAFDEKINAMDKRDRHPDRGRMVAGHCEACGPERDHRFAGPFISVKFIHKNGVKHVCKGLSREPIAPGRHRLERLPAGYLPYQTLGMVGECEVCGRTWVCEKVNDWRQGWRPEGRLERRRREWRTRKVTWWRQ